MTKIMLVEDDKSLREIYGVRLLAEGYDIVSAGDGEQALAMAIKERPHLIISDVMMPKISGFDLLDILRSTTETKNTKVIMMTALSSEDQRLRGEQLGADKYLVKSQVGIEDVVRVVHEVLGDGPQAQQSAPATPTTQPQPAPPVPQPPMPAPQAQPMTTPTAPAFNQNYTQQNQAQPDTTTTPQPAQTRARVIQPLNDPTASTVNMNELLDKELAKEAGVAEDARPTIGTTEQEKAQIEQQMANFTPQTMTQEEEEKDIASFLHQQTVESEGGSPDAPSVQQAPPVAEQPTGATSQQSQPQEQPTAITPTPEPPTELPMPPVDNQTQPPQTYMPQPNTPPQGTMPVQPESPQTDTLQQQPEQTS